MIANICILVFMYFIFGPAWTAIILLSFGALVLIVETVQWLEGKAENFLKKGK